MHSKSSEDILYLYVRKTSEIAENDSLHSIHAATSYSKDESELYHDEIGHKTHTRVKGILQSKLM